MFPHIKIKDTFIILIEHNVFFVECVSVFHFSYKFTNTFTNAKFSWKYYFTLTHSPMMS